MATLKEQRAQREAQYKQAFLDWVKRDNICVVDTLPGSNLRKGMMVMFTNDYGVTFGPHEVLGFTPEPSKYGECVYFVHDAYWAPCRPAQLTPVEKGAKNE